MLETLDSTLPVAVDVYGIWFISKPATKKCLTEIYDGDLGNVGFLIFLAKTVYDIMSYTN